MPSSSSTPAMAVPSHVPATASRCGATLRAIRLPSMSGPSATTAGASALTTFKFADLVAAGPQGITKDLGGNGKLSAMVDDQNNFYVAWNGGPFGATGRDSFAKPFNCAFKR